MKAATRKWYFWVFSIVLIISILTIYYNITNKGVGSAGISLEEFDKIELGMSQFTVNSIIDELDEWNDDSIYEMCCKEISTKSENSIYQYTYKYLGENSGYAIITYTADYSKSGSFVLPTVSNMEKFNLK